MKHHYVKTKGFTLAEVLVTLGIIGVVSAMTVPTLMQNYQRKSYVTQLHKVYNELQQGLLQFQTDNNAINYREAGINSQEAAEAFFEKYFKIVQKCTDDSCVGDSYTNMGGHSTNVERPVYYVLANGASVGFAYADRSINFLLMLYVDVNGKKGPNIAGRDMFAVYVYNNGYIDDETVSGTGMPPFSKEEREKAFEEKCNDATATNWYGCFGKILNDNWEMTY